MQKYILGIVFLFFFSLTMSAQSATSDLTGTWIAWGNILEIYEDENGLQGIYVDENGNQTQEEKVVQNLVFRDDVWQGKLFSKKRNRTTKIKCTLSSPTELKVKLIIGFFSRSVKWVRADKDKQQ